jgi:hypothetical protein
MLLIIFTLWEHLISHIAGSEIKVSFNISVVLYGMPTGGKTAYVYLNKPPSFT